MLFEGTVDEHTFSFLSNLFAFFSALAVRALVMRVRLYEHKFKTPVRAFECVMAESLLQVRNATSEESVCTLEQLRTVGRKLEARCGRMLPATQHTWYLHAVIRHILTCMERFGQPRCVVSFPS